MQTTGTDMRDSKARSRPAHMRVAAAQLLLTSVAPMAGLDLYDAGAKLVAELIVDQYPDLLEIELDDNRISDASAEVLGAAIRTSTELRTLHLDGNDLTADAVQHLIEPLCSGKLRRLHFNDNMLGDAGATLLASLIERSHTLRVLNLKRAPPSLPPRVPLQWMRSKCQRASHRIALRTGNGIGEQGARALLTAVRNSGSPFLQHVRVQGNDVPEEMQEEIDFAVLERSSTLHKAGGEL